tara:strand:+ start:888 stop:1127 length:240 start_codon:yes stop_codon:yes gene_type:complete
MNSEEVLRDIEAQITKLIAELLDKHGSEASLCIPAVLLKTTLQIYQHTLPTDDEVRDVINMSLESLKDLPPLIPKTTLH